jgi:RNA polymerase sigma factor (sigma-70 family)
MARILDVDIPADLVRRLRKGEPAAQAAIYGLLANAVYTLARRMLNNVQLAEEATQDTFVDVITRAATLKDSSAFNAWVRSIATNHCLMRLRSPWHSRRDGVDQAPEQAAEQALERAIDMQQALARLPARTRAVVWLHTVEGYTHEEIARMFGRTASFSKSQLARGYRQLQSMRERTTDTDVNPSERDDERASRISSQ